MAEGLNWLFKEAQGRGIFRGMEVGLGGPNLTHLQFADDTLIFSQANLEEIQLIKRLLRVFEVRSGLRINYHKTVLCGIGVYDRELQSYAQVLNAKPASYQ